jgi:hypothetical protein
MKNAKYTIKMTLISEDFISPEDLAKAGEAIRANTVKECEGRGITEVKIETWTTPAEETVWEIEARVMARAAEVVKKRKDMSLHDFA